MDQKMPCSIITVALALCSPVWLFGAPAAAAEWEVQASPCLNLRTSPNNSGTVVDCLPADSRVEVVENERDWVRVAIAGGRSGWVASQFLSQVEAPRPAGRVSQIELPVGRTVQIEQPVAVQGAAQDVTQFPELPELPELEGGSAVELQQLRIQLEIAMEELEAFRGLSESSDHQWAGRYEKLLIERDRALSSAKQLETQALDLARRVAELQRGAQPAPEVSSEHRQLERRVEQLVVRAEAAETAEKAARRDLAAASESMAMAAAETPQKVPEVAPLETPSSSPPVAEVVAATPQASQPSEPVEESPIVIEEPVATAQATGGEPTPDPMTEEAGAGEAPPPMQFTVRDLPVEVTVPLYLQNWSRAWSAQDVEAYLASYAENFQPAGGLSREQWNRQRAQRVSAPEFIEVTLGNIQFAEKGEEKVKMQFEQVYKSGTFSDRVLKELEMDLYDDGWLIFRETVLEKLE